MNQPNVIYVSQGAIHMLQDGGAVRRIESAFGKSLRERASQIQQRHAWKTQGRGAQFMSGMLWGSSPGQDAGEFPIHITGVCIGSEPGELLYTLETNDVSGVFSIDAGGIETRLFHTADFRLRHPALSPDGSSIAVALAHNTFTANIAVLDAQGAGFYEATEGDSVDFAPRWVPGAGRKLVYQSAGVGRDQAGSFNRFGQFAIHELDLDSGHMETLLEDEGHDLISPRKLADGTLYYIRKPHDRAVKASPLGIVKDTLLFPFRLSYAIFQFFNFFSMRYTGKPLVSPKGAAAKNLDPLQMMMWGNLANAAAVGAHGGAEQGQPLVPDSWQLVRRSAQGASKVLAKGVLSYDLASQGRVVYSNGNTVVLLTEAGHSEKLGQGRTIEQIAAA